MATLNISKITKIKNLKTITRATIEHKNYRSMIGSSIKLEHENFNN